jgi:tRNA(Leu) C34 or U34 (ribose-2'-O)-methylase TrmL
MLPDMRCDQNLLALIEPLGFALDDRSLKRRGWIIGISRMEVLAWLD